MNTRNDSTPEADKTGVPAKADVTRDDLTDPTLGLEPATVAPARDLTGTVLGDYLVLEIVGAGGAGQVYKAQHRHMGRVVAIKVMSHAASANPSLKRRFRRELKTSAKLLHPNIVTAFDAGEHDEILYLVMEYVDGRSLFRVVRDEGPLNVRQAMDYLKQAATGLTYAHAQGVIHRDIKPSNLMVDKSGRIKILDMGLARLNEVTSPSGEPASGELTQHGTVVGTAGYISPEQIASSRRVDSRTDIYSLGCTFHFLLTGQPPYSGTLMETLVAHARDPVPSLRELRGDMPINLDAVFQRMMAKDVDERFGSMEDVLVALEPFREGESTQSIGPAEAAAGTASAQGAAGTLPALPIKTDSSSLTEQKAVGLDIGTNASYISWIAEDGLPCGLVNAEGSAGTPSIVRFQDDSFAVGRHALESVSSGAGNIADHFVCGLGASDTRMQLGGKQMPREVLAGVIARHLAAEAQQKIGYFRHSVYTVPGCFGDRQRKSYEDAYYIAYLDTLQPINASTAVVVNFAFLHGWLNPRRPADEKTILAIRFGGGSFDATVFRWQDRCLRSLAICGDAGVSGGVWDDRIVKHVSDQLKSRHNIRLDDDPLRMLLLRQHCQLGKVALTDQDQIPFRVQVKGRTLEGILSRGFVNRLGTDLLQRAQALTEEALEASGVGWREVDHVLLAGGTTNMPIVRTSVQEWMGKRSIPSLMGKDAAPGGAALSAQMQIAGPGPSLDFQIEEVTGHYFGIRGLDRRTGQKKTSVVIPRNSRLPATAKRTFRTSKDGQLSLGLEIVEGIDSTGDDSRLVGTCQITNLPPGQPAGTPIEIELHVAENGTVSVFVESLATGRRSSPPIQRAGGMTPEQRTHWRDWLDTGSMCGQFA